MMKNFRIQNASELYTIILRFDSLNDLDIRLRIKNINRIPNKVINILKFLSIV